MSQDSAGALDGLESAASAWRAAFNERDAAAIAALYAEDAWLSNLGWTAANRDAIGQHFSEMFRERLFGDLQLKMEKAQIGDGAMAWASGEWIAELPQGQGSRRAEGHWLIVARPQDDGWKICAHAINMRVF